MRQRLAWIAAAVVAAAVVHLVVLYAVPWLVMGAAMRGVTGGAGANTAVFPPRADETSRTIVRPSPDLLYAACVYDLSERPLRIRAKLPRGTYWSISMFAANTDNFFKLNDREVGAPRLDLVLALPGTGVDLPGDARLVEAPTTRGIILTRTLVDDERRLAELDRARRLFVCEPF